VAERYILSFDLGGSSTEFILIDTAHDRSLWSTSIFIGAATVTERCLPGDPPWMSSVVHAGEAVRDALSPAISELRALLEGLNIPPHALPQVGTAGTATTLAAMFLKMNVYEPSRVNGLMLTEKWLTELIDLLSEMSLAERQRLAGLEKGREGIILGGALIIREVLLGLGRVRFTVVDSGLLEGLLLALIEKEYGWPASLSSPLTFRLQGR
jgi:exopolyphosphatase/guanosine-5'-triphosphate,3'-diphosphate pyrophosphatase